MKITKENIGQAIYALRQCAKEHEKETVSTFGIVTFSICNDVADYLENIQRLSLIDMPNEEELKKMLPYYPFAHKIDKEIGERLGWERCYNWLNSKIVR